MPRRAVFDPTDRSVFGEQRQRFDWSLLQNGFVHRYDTGFQLDAACARLATLGYLVHVVDGTGWRDSGDMHDALSEALSFPAYYGRNLDALSDVLSDVAAFAYGSDAASAGTVLAIRGFETIAKDDSATAAGVLDVYAGAARLAALYAHPMLCLVESTRREFGRVGGHSVHLGSVWDVAPDPPTPFGPDEAVEYEIHIQVAADDAGQYRASLMRALSPLLDSVGRWDVSAPSAVDERSEIFHTQLRPEPPAPGTRLLSMTIGVRGTGDVDELADGIVHALHDAGLRFERLIG